MSKQIFKIYYQGIDGRLTRKFATLAALQTYVKERWQGVDYIDGPAAFHTDYANYTISGAKILDLGHRGGERGTEGYWSWIWKDLNAENN